MWGLRYLKDVATLELDAEKCKGCGRCLEVCPHKVFRQSAEKAVIQDLDACMECGACARNCPFEAIRVQTGVGCAAALLQAGKNGGEPCCGPVSGCKCGE